jgi:uncharacterized delta-60 repeat protein
VITSFYGLSPAYAVASQADGKIVAVGGTGMYTVGGDDNNFALARYKPKGSLDPTFGQDGRVATRLEFFQEAHSVAIQDDGGIVVAGSGSYGGGGLCSLARYEPDGTPDATFGESGWVVPSSSGPACPVAVQADGKIVIAGASGRVGRGTGEVTLARYASNGALDPSFGSDGLVRTSLRHGSYVVYAIALQSDGRIVVAGEAADTILLARYEPDGSLDPTFGEGGLVIGDFVHGPDIGYDLAVQPDGRIVVVGRAADAILLARYEPDGSPDLGFGRGGRTITDATAGDDMGRGVAIEADGGIIVAGGIGVGWSPSHELRRGRFAVLRYEADGTLDPSFGRAGLAANAFGERDGVAYAVAGEANGGFVVAGLLGHKGPQGRFALARYAAATPNP